ncbi:MAG TPA: Rubrerythrin [Bacteroidetes bacterium]|nr:Rubrerythrin [Bacteroidota bacterium]HEX04528.1 Rubrerythrin [Bacteroidota bacterium]
MNSRFNTDEILEIAVKIEENGVAFYHKAAELAEDPTVKKLFSDLSAWEKTHVRQFSELHEKYYSMKEDTELFNPDSEATRYLKAIADGKIFVIDDMDNEINSVSDDAVAVMKIAIQREKDTILFYSAILDGLYDTFPKDDLKTIIDEEYSHVRYLSEKLAAL